MKKILFVTVVSGRGGTSRVMSRLMNHYAQRGWHVTYVFRNMINAYVLDGRIHVVELGKDPAYSRWYFVKWIRAFIKREKVDVVISFLVNPTVIALLGCLGTGTPVITSERNDPEQRTARDKRLAFLFYGLASVIVFQTKRAMNCYPKWLRHKGVVIRNPISVTCEANGASNCWVSVGRLEPQKNHAMLLRVFARYHRSFPDDRLTIYGDGSLRAQLEDYTRELEIDKYVSFPGNVSDIHEKIANAKAFILPSDYEGMSNMLLESMLMGLPCISTNCAGSDEIICDRRNGLLVPVRDEDALYKAMLYLEEDSSLRQKLGCNAKKTAEVYKEEFVLKVWDELIDKEAGCIKNGSEW